MDPKSLSKLIKTLKSSGVSYYKTPELELKLESEPPKPTRSRRNPKEEEKIKKAALDEITEDVLSDLLVSDPVRYENLMSELTTREAS